MEFTQSEFYGKSAVPALGSIMSIVCNVPVFVLLLTSRRLKEDIATFAVASLAIADFGMGAVVPMISAIIGSQGLGFLPPQELLTFYGCVFTVTMLSAIWNLALVSVIRCCVIIRPLRYHAIFSNRVLYGSIGALWCICILTCVVVVSMGARWGFNPISFTPYVANYTGSSAFAYIYAVLNTIIPASVIVVAYLKIFLVVRQHLKSIQPSESYGASNLTLSSIKAAKNLFVIIMVYGAAYLPVFVMFLPLNFPQWYIFVVTWVFYYNAALNPFLYVVLHKNVRKEFRKLFCPCYKT